MSPERSQTPETDRNLSERHSPIGAETSESEHEVDESKIDENNFDQKSFEVDEWDSWDASPEVFVPIENVETLQNGEKKNFDIENVETLQKAEKKSFADIERRKSDSLSSPVAKPSPVKRLLDFDDISRLDIKVSGGGNNVGKPVDDFFADMTPVISEAPKFDPTQTSKFDVLTSKFDPTQTDAEGDGWDGDGWN